MAVNLLRFTVSSEQPAQNSHPPHPGYLLRHSSIGSTLSLTYTHMPALPASQGVFPASSPGMDSHRLPDDQPIFDQLPDLLAGAGIGDFISLIGVQPDLLFATAKDAGGKPLLKPEHTHGRGRSGESKDVGVFQTPLDNSFLSFLVSLTVYTNGNPLPQAFMRLNSHL